MESRLKAAFFLIIINTLKKKLTKINIQFAICKKMLILQHQNKLKQNKMKKFGFALMAVAFGLIVACGPSADEKAAKEKATQDSIAQADSIAKAEAAAAATADSIAKAEAAAAAAADSIAKAEEAAKAGKKK